MPQSKIKQPITVCPFNQFDEKFQISIAYSTPMLNVNAVNVTELNYVCDAFNELRHKYFPYIAEGKIEALLDVNAFAFTHPTEVIQGTEIRLFGIKTKLGRTLAGEYLNTLGNRSSKSSNNSKVFVYHRKSPEQPLDNLLQEFWSIENDGTRKEDNSITEDEKSAIRILESTMNHTGERYQIGLPWKVPANLQNKYFSALNQLNNLNKRLNNDPKLSDMYQQTLVTDLEKNYVKPVEMTDPNPEKIWYLPHHPVQSANKPNKVRRVANAASKFKGESLNSNLLTGPDLLNSLIGILFRFRDKPIAILTDIEGMFMQNGIRNEDQSALRFLWSIDNDVRQFQFTRLSFGATCSSSCAIFALNRCAEDNVETYPKAQSTIKSYFYMNDYIQSFDSPENANATAYEVRNCLRAVGFRLTKFLSNHQQALQCITPEDLEEPKSETRVLGQNGTLKKVHFSWNPPEKSLKKLNNTLNGNFSVRCHRFLTQLGFLAQWQ